jgi:hypothetical protein
LLGHVGGPLIHLLLVISGSRPSDSFS